MSDPTPEQASARELGPPVIEVRDVVVNFAGRVGLVAGLLGKKAADASAVAGVNLTLREGEVMALAGESGCGKTTIARAIMGLLQPQAGQILYRGQPLSDLKAYRREVQMVFQDPTAALNPRQTIYECVAEGLRVHRIHQRAGWRDRGATGRLGAVTSGPAAPRALLPAVPARTLGGPAAACGDRRARSCSNRR